MPRYVDADWITQNLEGWQDQLAETYGQNDEYVLCLGEVLMKLDDTPTADVVEVVRCKDCKYGVDWDGRLGCEWHGFYQTEPNWFCADGERRDDG